MFEIGLMIGMIIVASAVAKRISGGKADFLTMRRGQAPRRVSAAERKQALEVYERLVQEKLDVLRTALAMGYGHDDLSRLDSRLERLIGKDQLEQLAAGYVPLPSAELSHVNLTDEVRKLKEMRSTR